MTKREKLIKGPKHPSQKHCRASSSSTILTIKETLRTALLKTQSLRCFQISHPIKMCSNSPAITKIKRALVVHRLHHIFLSFISWNVFFIGHFFYLNVLRSKPESDFVILPDLPLVPNHKCTLFWTYFSLYCLYGTIWIKRPRDISYSICVFHAIHLISLGTWGEIHYICSCFTGEARTCQSHICRSRHTQWEGNAIKDEAMLSM